MPYIAVKCPNCGGDLQLDDKLERGYCVHCGTPIYYKDTIQKVKIQGSVKVAGIPKLANLILLIKKDLELGRNQTPEFRDRLYRALNLDPDNPFLYNLQISKIWNAEISDGILLKYKGNVERFVVPYCITCINSYAFQTCRSLNEIIIPKNVELKTNFIFTGNPKLMIITYSGTCAAKYAEANNIFLYLLDGSEKIQNCILKIRESIVHINDFKNTMLNEIAQYTIKKKAASQKFTKIFLIILLILDFFLIFNPNIRIPKKPVFSFFSLSLIGIIFFYTLGPADFHVYNVEQRYLKDMFFQHCSSILYSAEIVGFKYKRTLWNDSAEFAQEELKKVVSAKNSLINIDIKKFINRHKFKKFQSLPYR